MTRGVRTSEFWITAAVVIAGLLVSAGVLPANVESVIGLLVAAIGGGTYTLGRSGLKKTEAAKVSPASLYPVGVTYSDSTSGTIGD